MGSRRKPIPVEIQRRITKFFITNLPDRCSGSDLAGVLRGYGVIFGIYIAKKRDKGGKRFGFVSFLDVRDIKEMLRRMYNIKMGAFKLEINVARFILEDGEIREEYVHKQKAPNIPPSHNTGNINVRFAKKGTFSFKEALTGDRKKEEVQNKTLILDDHQPVMEDLHGRSLFIKLGSFAVLRNLRSILSDMGLKGGRLRYLGGLQLLITFNSIDHATMAKDELLGRPKDFSLVESWKGQEIDFEKIAWVKIQGIPMHLMNDETMDKVAGLFGTVIHKTQLEEDDLDLSYYYAALLVNSGKIIQGEVSLMWKDKLYSVWVYEDTGARVPDFLNEGSCSLYDESVDSSSSSSEEADKSETGSVAADKEEVMQSDSASETELDA
ncbi:nucleotide-binding alpha-beta plait domain-containing protein [Artemisia annua]|uniref:Nucleotide-binding alpha-beta plait domain-containing protein n=1 Tax=Artemisia annua TaxID=35608 RepID=A0A2U1KTM3_ARTAN|nr:nucleotide-binding alpha-beta plait domain-containing protein [Artemisia annua]